MSFESANAAETDPSQHPSQSPLSSRLSDTRRLSVELAEPLSDEDQVVQAMDDASPTKWHLAHTTWFFETFVLNQFDETYAPYDERFAFCFNSYYEAEGERHPRQQRGLLTRPSNREVRGYRSHVDAALQDFFTRKDNDVPAKAAELIELGIQHEQQHQELMLTDALSLFSMEPLKPAYREVSSLPQSGPATPLEWVDFEGGIVEVGHSGDGFAYDNERPNHEALLRPFRLATRCVTNAEWLEFMVDGGYDAPALWLSDGLAAAREGGWRAPLYWQEDAEGWRQMGLHGLQPVDPAAPVSHVSYFEADAFARWAGKRLPTEFEWERAARDCPQRGNMLGHGALRPLAAKANGTEGPKQMYGDVWEWTQSPYSPYPGFKAAAGALGEYNGKFMCNQFVLRGGSCATPDGHIRPTYRNFFYPHQRWQFTGLRLAEDR
jgi:ergothioneine biosynthesis protein EgtB